MASRLLELDLAAPADWKAVKKSPIRFLGRTLARWIREAGAEGADKQVGVAAAIVDRGQLQDVPPTLERMLITVEVHSYNIVVMKHVVAWLEGVHPRLPATWYDLFCTAASRSIGTWTVGDAEDHVDTLEDYYDQLQDEHGADGFQDGFERPNPRGEFLPALKEAPLAASTVRRLMRGLDKRRRTVLDLTLQLAEAAKAAPGAMFPANFWDDLDDYEPGCVAIVVVMEHGDAIERAWDEASDMRVQSGFNLAPAVAIEFDATNNDSITQAHAQFMAVARSVGLIARILDLLPNRDPQSLAEVFRGEQVES